MSLRIGAHMSVAGGVSKAVDRGVLHGCEALQIFSKNANQWLGKPLDPGEVHVAPQPEHAEVEHRHAGGAKARDRLAPHRRVSEHRVLSLGRRCSRMQPQPDMGKAGRRGHFDELWRRKLEQRQMVERDDRHGADDNTSNATTLRIMER